MAAWHGIERPPQDRSALANSFVAKAVLGLTTSVALIERLAIDRALRRICGFPRGEKLPGEATFSRAFAEFANSRLAERVHESLIKAHLGQELIGHISCDGTAIAARERPAKPVPAQAPVGTGSAAAAQVAHDGRSGGELLRRDGCGLLQHRVAGAAWLQFAWLPEPARQD